MTTFVAVDGAYILPADDIMEIRNNDLPYKQNIFIKSILPRIIMDTIRQQLDKNALKRCK